MRDEQEIPISAVDPRVALRAPPGVTMSRITTCLLIAILAGVAPPEAFALITGGEGNKPITDPGWPAGAAAIFNHPGRIAWWEGPPFGGGQWHAE